MSVVYITEQGANVKKSGQRIIVVKEKQILLDLPVFQIDRILVFGYIQVTTQALILLLNNGSEISYLTRGGKLVGKMAGSLSKNVFLRLAQHRVWVERERRQILAECFVRGKIRNQKAVLKKFERQGRYAFGEIIALLDQEISKLNGRFSIQELMGIEGISSRVYFSGLTRVMREIPFTGREKHPSPDPVNALLSFGYVMLTNELSSLLEAFAFDPYIGFLHSLRYGRRALALDLIEEFRQPVVDVFVANLVNKKIFTADDFEEAGERKLYLTPDALKRFFIEWEAWHRSVRKIDNDSLNWRQVFARQAECLEKALIEGIPYVPYFERDIKK